MRAILINPETKTIEEVDVQLHVNGERPYAQIYKLLGVDLITAVTIEQQLDWSGETIFVDDEGLLHEGQKYLFQWKDYHQPLAGKGLILGTDEEGESIGTKLNLEYVKSMVEFPDLEFDHFEPIPDHETTIHGHKFFVVGHTPVFKPKDKQ